MLESWSSQNTIQENEACVLALAMRQEACHVAFGIDIVVFGLGLNWCVLKWSKQIIVHIRQMGLVHLTKHVKGT